MFFNPEDDDDFSPSFGAGKSNLSSLFGASVVAKEPSNDSLTYTAPKQPKKQTAANSQDAPSVIHAVVAQTYKFVNGQYASQGKLGVAVLGSHAKKEYRLLVYASQQKQITSAKITSNFSFVVQPNNYASFYDDSRLSWSLRFDSAKTLVDFAKQVGVARYNVAPGTLVKQDLMPGEGQAIETGDIIEVKYTGSLLSNNAFGKVFDSNANADKLFKFRPGKGKVIKGWEEGVIGMKKGGKRLLGIPPELAYGEKGVPSRVPQWATLLFEVEISRVKFAREKTENVSHSSTESPPSTSTPEHKEDVNSSASSGHSRDEEVRERTASLNKELSTSPEKGSEKAKLLARMSKMGKNVLKLSETADVDEEEMEHEGLETSEHHVEDHPSEHVTSERPRAHSHESAGNPHSQSPGKPRVPPRSANVNRVAHSAAHAPPPSHVNHPHASQAYSSDYQGDPRFTPVPQQHQVALYQAPMMLAPPPVYQQPAQYGGYQQPQFQPQVFPQPVQNIFPAQPLPAQPTPPAAPAATSSTSSGTSDAMMPLLMSESRQHQTEVRQAINKVSEKIEGLEQKINHLKQSGEENQGAIRPAGMSGLSSENIMEASVLMNSIVKLVQENERMKKENVEKTAKVEALNEKISELLHRSQKYVEQSNIFLEQRSESLQQSSSYSQSKLVELEREKTSLSTELGTLKQNVVTMETELEILRKQDVENREQLKKASSQLHKNKAEFLSTKENLTEKEEELAKLSSSLKTEKQERKKLEGKFTNLEETASDLKVEKESLEKSLSDRKKKQQQLKKTMDEEMEEMKNSHEEELNSLKDRYRRELTSSSTSLSQQIAQTEADIQAKWDTKSKQMVNQCEMKWQQKYDDLIEERDILRKKLLDSEEKYGSIKTLQNTNSREIEELQEKVKDLDDTKKKYHELRTKSIEMKEEYERKLEDAMREKTVAVREAYQKSSQKTEKTVEKQEEPPREKIVEEVKKVMNTVFFKIRGEFEGGKTYQGSNVVSVVLNVIKTMTLKLTSGKPDEESEEESEEEESEDEEEDEEEVQEEERKEENIENRKEDKKEDVESEEESEEESEDESEDESEEEEQEKKEDVDGKVDIEQQQVNIKEEQNGNEDKEEVLLSVETKAQPVRRDKQEENEEEEHVEMEDASEEEGLKKTSVVEDKADEPDSPDNDVQQRSTVVIQEHLPQGESISEEEGNGDETVESEGGYLKVSLIGREDDEESRSEGNVDNLSNVSVHGSDDGRDVSGMPSFDNEMDGISQDTYEQHEQEKAGSTGGQLIVDLPSVDELTGSTPEGESEKIEDNEDSVSAERDIEEGDSRNSGDNDEVEERREEENEEIVKEESAVSEVAEAKSEEAKTERKIQSLDDLLSDTEDDVEGLFDVPVKKELTTTAKNKTEQEPSLKPTPPPLFDDDDDDDLDWLS